MSDLTEYFVRHYTLVIDNTEQGYNAATRAAVRVVRDSGVTLTEYTALSDKELAERYASDIGSKIMDLVSAWFTEAVVNDTIGGMLAYEIMILSSSELAWNLGKHYMPEKSALDSLLDDDDDDSDDE